MHDHAAVEIADATRISRSTSLLVAGVNDDLVMMDLKLGRYYGLDRVGADVWSRLETPVTFAALIDSLVGDYDADRDRIAADVRQLLAVMVRHNVVELG